VRSGLVALTCTWAKRPLAFSPTSPAVDPVVVEVEAEAEAEALSSALLSSATGWAVPTTAAWG
jgi:hypothetical protein